MKRLLLAASLASLPLVATASPENYVVDSLHTYTNFTVDRALSTMYGRFDKNSGRFTIDRAAKTGSVDFTIETASISTGDNDKGARARSRDEHLRSADFFNVAEFPRMTFKSTAVRFGPELPQSVEGNLTLLGTTKPVTLTFEKFRCAAGTPPRKDRCGGNAVGKLKRSDYGMKFGVGPGISDEITLMIAFEGEKE